MTKEVNAFTIPIVSREEFRLLLETNLLKSWEDYAIIDVIQHLLSHGMPKLDWDRLNTCLSEMDVYLAPVAVEASNDFMWVVNGRNAMLVKKT